ncbi:MAG: hypothetical protein EBZ67_01000 [Chitinophagia bacterium]|nr:hypothetical protein [Chitinophagia bacterium]
MADDWDGMVLDDYRAVLPLPRRRKYGIDYLCPMPFSGSLAVYGKDPLPCDTLDVLQQIPARFRLWDINLEVQGRDLPWPSTTRKNHVLPLYRPYAELSAGFRETLRQTLQQERENGFARTGISIDKLLKEALSAGSLAGTSPSDLLRLKRLYEDLSVREKAFTLGWVEDGRTVAGALFFRSPGRIYYMAAWSGEEGRQCGAAARLLDTVIREYSGMDTVLDFEGSDIPGVAFFFEGFGAKPETYRLVQRRRFPFLY